jgi:hypothetical protein
MSSKKPGNNKRKGGKGKGDVGPSKEDRNDAPPPPPPRTTPPEAHSVEDGWIDGKTVHDAMEHVLAACPKASDSPALAFVLLRGCEMRATDDRVLNTATLPAPISQTAVKVTRQSFEAVKAVVKGERQAADAREASSFVQWTGLVLKIRRTGSLEEHVETLDIFEGGPDAEHIGVHTPTRYAGHLTLTLDAVRDAMRWKGDGSLDVFVDEEEGRLWLDVSSGGAHMARTICAARNRSLGIRQPTLPGVDRPTRTAPHGTKPSAPEDAPETGRVLLLGSGTGWCRIECNRSGVWDRLAPTDLSDLAPYAVNDTVGVVVWGPLPSQHRRVGYLMARLVALGLDPREVPCDGPDLSARQLGPGENATTDESRQLGPGIIDAEFEEVPTPTPPKAPKPITVEVKVSKAAFGDAVTALSEERRKLIDYYDAGEAGTVVVVVTPGAEADEELLARLDLAGAIERWWCTDAGLDDAQGLDDVAWHDAGDGWRGTILTPPVTPELGALLVSHGATVSPTLAALRKRPESCAVPGFWVVAARGERGWHNAAPEGCATGQVFSAKANAVEYAQRMQSQHGEGNVALVSDKGKVSKIPAKGGA